jgi:putative membrane protein
MNAFSTASAITILAASTAAFASYGSHDVGALSGIASCQIKGQAAQGSVSSTAFAATAAQDGMVEVALAGLALEKSHDEHVRQLAQRMIQDYAQSNGRLDSIVKCEGLVLPTDLDAKHKATIRRLSSVPDGAFDRAYLKHIGEKRATAVALYQSASGSGDPAVAAFARESLSMLREHEGLADNVRASMGSRVASTR